MDGVASAAMSSDKLAPWFYDGADEKGRIARTAFWQGKTKSVTVAFFTVIKSAGENVKDVPTVPGSYLTPSGGTGDGLGGRRTLPTASGARRDDPRGRKRVKAVWAKAVRGFMAFCSCRALSLKVLCSPLF